MKTSLFVFVFIQVCQFLLTSFCALVCKSSLFNVFELQIRKVNKFHFAIGLVKNMYIVPILSFLFGFVLINCPLGVFSQMASIESHQKSILRPAVERVFSRKKRWMIFPEGSNLKFTVSVSKRLLALYPKGFNFNLEAAVYYPMPSARIDLIPKRFRRPTTQAPAAKGPTPLFLVGIPGSLIKYRAKPATKPAEVQRLDQNISSLQWAASPSPTLYLNSSRKGYKYSFPEFMKNRQWSSGKQQKYAKKYSKYNSKWFLNSRTPQLLHPFTHYNWNHRPRSSRADPILSSDELDFAYKPFDFEELEPFEDSPHYHSYRSRRELFHHFEGLSEVLGIDMKSCILRAVCDSKQFLLPTGYSMIQDILRVVFTFPTITGLKDDYSRIMAAEYRTCDAHVHNKCPFSILDWLLNTKKSPCK